MMKLMMIMGRSMPLSMKGQKQGQMSKYIINKFQNKSNKKKKTQVPEVLAETTNHRNDNSRRIKT